MSICIALGLYVTVNANQEVQVDYKHDIYRQAKKLEAERDYHQQKEAEHKQIKEVKKEEAIEKWWEYIAVENGLSTSPNEYKTAREEYLYTKVTKTVDLPWFGDYQDLLASYAYNTCNIAMKDEAKVKNGYKYDCQTMILVMNSENGWWDKDVMGAMNGNGTVDGWLFQLNNKYHSDFIESEWFSNGLAQIDYGLGVWKDASRKGTMPWFGYHPRFARDKWIEFTY